MLLERSVSSLLCLGELVVDIDVAGSFNYFIPVLRRAGG
jgi:hypothetical protein